MRLIGWPATHLAGRDTGLAAEDPIHYFHYFTMHAEEWRSARTWPPTRTERRYFTVGAGELRTAVAAPPSTRSFQVDFAFGTGSQTRYERIAGIEAKAYYEDWGAREATLPHFTSAPLEAALEIVGHPFVALWLASSEPDAALLVYLSEIEADGTSRYVTEGVLRAIHRAESEPPANYRASWPWHSFARRDARPMPREGAELVRFALLPTAWRFAAGSRLRLSIAGGDADHFVQAPHGRPPRLDLLCGGERASMLLLPVV